MADREIRESDYSARQPIGIIHAEGAVVFLRIMSGLAWLDSARAGKDAKFSARFLGGAELAESLRKSSSIQT